MSLQGKTAVVTGVSGTVGAGILDQFLRAGATVIAPIRGDKDALLKSLGDVDVSRLDVVTANVSEESSVLELASYIQEKYGSLDHAVTSVGGWWQKGPLLQTSVHDYMNQYRTFVLSHFLLAKYLLPIMKDTKESSFIFVSGSAGEAVMSLDANLVTAHLNAQYGLIMCVKAESEGKGARINELRIGAVIRREDEETNNALPQGIRDATGEFSHRTVGRAAVKLALDASGGQQFLKVGPPELQQLTEELQSK